MTQMSLALRKIASTQKIVLLALCQLNRAIEDRAEYVPVMRDLRDTGQLEQDADVIISSCWPYKMNQDEPIEKFQFFILKNRNRPINQHMVSCRFIPSRQQILETKPETINVPDPTSYGFDR